MTFQEVSNKVDFVVLEKSILDFWQETDAFNELRRLRAKSESQYGTFSFLDGPITANNPMGVHHAWGRTYKDLYQRYHAMLGKNERWQNGFDCQGLWVEVEVEKELGFKSKRDIEAFGMEEFIKRCKARVLNFAAVQTEQSTRLGYWTDWNNPQELRRLAQLLLEDPTQEITVAGPNGFAATGWLLFHLQRREQLPDLELLEEMPRQWLVVQRAGRNALVCPLWHGYQPA